MGFKVREGKRGSPHHIHKKDENIEYDDSVTAIIDLDLLAYKAASAVETRFINVTHKPSGKIKRFDNRTAFYGRGKKKDSGWLGEINYKRKEPFLLEDFEIKDDREVEDISHCFHTLKHMVDEILYKCKTSKYECYLGEGRNVRNSIATVDEYKAGRSDMIKPLYLKDVREYCVRRFGAIVIKENEDLTNLEADDYLSIRAYDGYLDYIKTGKCSTVQISQDKDSRQCYGMFLDHDKMDKPFLVKDYGKVYLDDKGKVRGFGDCFLLFQMVAGDKIDSYQPAKLSGKKFGDKSAYKLLKDTNSVKEGLEAVVAQYKEWYPKAVTYPHCITGEDITKTWIELAEEYFQLAYMRRSLEDDSTFKGWLDKEGVDYAEET